MPYHEFLEDPLGIHKALKPKVHVPDPDESRWAKALWGVNSFMDEFGYAKQAKIRKKRGEDWRLIGIPMKQMYEAFSSNDKGSRDNAKIAFDSMFGEPKEDEEGTQDGTPPRQKRYRDAFIRYFKKTPEEFTYGLTLMQGDPRFAQKADQRVSEEEGREYTKDRRGRVEAIEARREEMRNLYDALVQGKLSFTTGLTDEEEAALDKPSDPKEADPHALYKRLTRIAGINPTLQGVMSNFNDYIINNEAYKEKGWAPKQFFPSTPLQKQDRAYLVNFQNVMKEVPDRNAIPRYLRRFKIASNRVKPIDGVYSQDQIDADQLTALMGVAGIINPESEAASKFDNFLIEINHPPEQRTQLLNILGQDLGPQKTWDAAIGGKILSGLVPTELMTGILKEIYTTQPANAGEGGWQEFDGETGQWETRDGLSADEAGSINTDRALVLADIESGKLRPDLGDNEDVHWKKWRPLKLGQVFNPEEFKTKFGHFQKTAAYEKSLDYRKFKAARVRQTYIGSMEAALGIADSALSGESTETVKTLISAVSRTLNELGAAETLSGEGTAGTILMNNISNMERDIRLMSVYNQPADFSELFWKSRDQFTTYAARFKDLFPNVPLPIQVVNALNRQNNFLGITEKNPAPIDEKARLELFLKSHETKVEIRRESEFMKQFKVSKDAMFGYITEDKFIPGILDQKIAARLDKNLVTYMDEIGRHVASSVSQWIRIQKVTLKPEAVEKAYSIAYKYAVSQLRSREDKTIARLLEKPGDSEQDLKEKRILWWKQFEPKEGEDKANTIYGQLSKGMNKEDLTDDSHEFFPTFYQR